MGGGSIRARLLLLAMAMAVAGGEDAVRCLRGVKDSLSDPQGKLASSWVFENTTVGFVCFFPGVSCWNPSENRVQKLQLSSMALAGQIPPALQFCSDTDELDLSRNAFSGGIPAELCRWLPNLVTLDLSFNSLSGQIPPELANCRYLNRLDLSGNRLSGSIPSQLSGLSRLKSFSVAGNGLSGGVPAGLAAFPASSFGGNSGLCGGPLGKCGGLSRRSLAIIVSAGVVGAIASVLAAVAVFRFWLGGRAGGGALRPGNWAERLRHHRMVQVSLFQKPIVKVRLGDLMAATGDFADDRLLSGSTYRAVLSDGSVLAVKRLPLCQLPERQFRQEATRLGLLRHPNLVPLLGFCCVLDEHLLVYKHMPGGPLSAALNSPAGGLLDWNSRLRIAVGAARGLAWLHHGVPSPLLHQSFSSSVVLLDDDGEARVSEFGLAQLASGAAGDGRLGYDAPELQNTMVPSMKGDVYSFGVVLMELATGRRPGEAAVAEEGFKGTLVEWVGVLAGGGRLADAIDGALRRRGHDEEILKLLKMACSCVAARPRERPAMHQVYHSLKAMATSGDPSDHYDEFPLVYNREEQVPR
ncbi:leucine-rich repeat protein kinase family protein [Wolffia australiana]